MRSKFSGFNRLQKPRRWGGNRLTSIFRKGPDGIRDLQTVRSRPEAAQRVDRIHNRLSNAP